MNVLNKFLAIAIPYLVGAACGAGAVLLFVAAGLWATNAKLGADLRAQRDANTAITASAAALKRQLADADTALATANSRLIDLSATVSRLEQSLGAVQSAAAAIGHTTIELAGTASGGLEVAQRLAGLIQTAISIVRQLPQSNIISTE